MTAWRHKGAHIDLGDVLGKSLKRLTSGVLAVVNHRLELTIHRTPY